MHSMAVRRPFLSKSRLIAAWQCPKRLFLETEHPDLAEISARTESLWETGHEVGRVAKILYGSGASVEVPFDRRTGIMLARTAELVGAGARFPIFEATFRHENVLVRVDVLVPDGNGWRLVEVKASTSIKDYHALDCAIQAWVLRGAGVELNSVRLAHVDNRFVYPGDGNYAGLLIEHDLTDEVCELAPEVVELVARAREAATGPEPLVRVGGHCGKPYDCPFLSHCWPHDTDYPVTGLGGGRAKLGDLVALGCRDIRDVDAGLLGGAAQRRIHRVTCAGVPEVLDGGRQAFEALAWPRYYLDFETVAPAVPIWPGTRPYATLPVQYSCHVESRAADGTEILRHREFLDLSGTPPMRGLALSLIECLGESGPVLTYTGYEQTVIESLIGLYPDLEARLRGIVGRLFDMQPVVKANYYHPRMLGSWSLKAVIPAINPAMDYERLEGIRDGTAASNAFLEAIAPATAPSRKAELEAQMRRYCRFDTEAMVEIVRFFTCPAAS